MSEVSINTHISRQFNAELENLRQQVLDMGALVEQQIAGAIEALVQSDRDRAEEVIARDVEVNAMEVAIDEACNHILIRRQPTASDLRLVVAVIKTITDLERIGDEAEKIARMAAHLATQEGGTDSYADAGLLGNHVCQMVRDAMDAFARLDPQQALAIAKSDEQVDRRYEGLMRQCITLMMEDTRAIRRMLDVLWAVRALERIGDHACNICEYVIYLVGGKDVRHTSLKDLEQEVFGG